MTLLAATDLTLYRGARLISDRLHFTIHAGEIWAVLGANGVGKTTFLHALASLHPLHSGKLYWQDKALTHFNRLQIAQKIALLLQQPATIFPCRVLDYLLAAREPHLAFSRALNQQDNELIEDIMQNLKLVPLAQRDMTTLSGGELQRVMIASTLAQTTELLLFDEPMNHLDHYYQITIMNYVTHFIQQMAASAVMILHDVNVVERFCSHVLLFTGEGNILVGNKAAVLSSENLRLTYQQPFEYFDTPDGKIWYNPVCGGHKQHKVIA